jgi:DNA-binding protein YbaB
MTMKTPLVPELFNAVMDGYLTKSRSSDQKDAELKRLELARLSHFLAEKEMELAELKLALLRFQHRYFFEVGRKYVELDALKARISEIRCRENLHEPKFIRQASQARRKAEKSAGEYDAYESGVETLSEKITVSFEGKKLYRKIAALIHPDKADDKSSRIIRTRLMAALNDAYSRGDIQQMRDILAEWESSPEAVSEYGTAAEIIRLVRTIAQLRRRIRSLDNKILQIMASDMYILMNRVDEADAEGRDLLKELAQTIDSQIVQAKKELSEVEQRSSNA